MTTFRNHLDLFRRWLASGGRYRRAGSEPALGVGPWEFFLREEGLSEVVLSRDDQGRALTSVVTNRAGRRAYVCEEGYAPAFKPVPPDLAAKLRAREREAARAETEARDRAKVEAWLESQGLPGLEALKSIINAS